MSSLTFLIEQVDHSHKYSLYPINFDDKSIRGIIAIQVFAATKRANKDGAIERNYHKRLNDLIFHNMTKLNIWMGAYQDKIWANFYKWCSKNHFRVSKKCSEGFGPGRYTQYPLQEASRVFTLEALLNFARAFVDMRLTPEDDLNYDVFWDIIPWNSLYSYIGGSKHAEIVYTKYSEDAKQQIYNFFLRWDGVYRVSNYSESRRSIPQVNNILYLSEDFETFKTFDATSRKWLGKPYALSSARYRAIANEANCIPRRRDGVFIFRHDDVYELWEEVRYLEEDQQGIAVFFPEEFDTKYNNLRNCPTILTMPRCKIVKLTYCPELSRYFIEKRSYYLEGGLKIGRDQFLLGAAPIFVREKPVAVRIDKNKLQDNSARVNLNYLGNGTHVISIPGHKSIRFELLDLSTLRNNWNADNHTWEINRSNVVWGDTQESSGVSGMDMSAICQEKNLQLEETPALQAWCKIHMGLPQNSNNIVNKTLKAIIDNDNI